jgi:toxoflavin synthase
LRLGQQFDFVVAAYLLNYARDRAELRAMCAGIADCLKPGGRFVTVNCNPALDFTAAPSYRQYGFETRPVGAWREGTPITWTFFVDGSSFEIENYHLNVTIHEEAFKAAGFREVRWHEPCVSPETLSAHEPGFWLAFLAQPPVAFIECVK